MQWWVSFFLIVVALIVVCFGLVVGWNYGVFTTRYPKFIPNASVPHIIHLMYFPWNQQQQLLADPDAFDHTYYQTLCTLYPEWTIMMWTLPRVRALCEKHYPGVWETAIAHAVRPTQLVDLFRWLVVYHFGGLYLQYDSQLHVSPDQLLPSSNGHRLRLYTEFVWVTPMWRWIVGRQFAIRNGAPEEKWRIMNQIFAAVPKHPYVRLAWNSILERMKIWKPKCDYDILFIGANALVSELYDKIGLNQTDIERINFWQTRHLITISSKASWRTDPHR
jgi:hypothetical protein